MFNISEELQPKYNLRLFEEVHEQLPVCTTNQRRIPVYSGLWFEACCGHFLC